ncbi:hypothetical protein [Actinoplanes sp. ATCC 53533]|uniref:hypothetical protein n=1 Tax=Actinoplanes sp. ATCC 53533 TaxID=1288362 RepID=UPI0013153449|nr:hypothetical protein [Actinoplanes sp. ATCC 53533]
MGRQVAEVVAQAPVADCAPGAANVEITPKCGEVGAGTGPGGWFVVGSPAVAGMACLTG